ncbi:hypothetical protein L3X38_012992 [Prunus dulcis]|uniref:Uncharacterized protein n=1 Tax=Prunus dulcis TaxID=3755 RepID=A0AAD4ZGK1_PRUDU|nr:hypothetical protein L3X38_012992 [Prunus dulcis]
MREVEVPSQNQLAMVGVAQLLISVTPQTGSAVPRYCPLWAWLHSHQPARLCFWELTKQLPRVVTHPGIAPASNSLNFGVPTNPKPVSSQKASPRSEWRSGLDPTLPSMILSSLGLATFSPARKPDRLRRSAILVVTYPGIAPASNSLNFGVPTNPKPVSSQKASPRSEWRSGLDPTLPSMILSSLGLATFSPARKDLFLGAHGATSQGITHPGITPASNSLNFGVLTTPKPVSSQKASRYEDARCAI